ncbi:IS200/IS605 family transposase [Candidatus Nomurabacteria bacterium]|uniref:IS200/IS605 family transposase n=1 Tax=Candidatus Dojkabacteria bacterium TaxID=2099670 RepID=A0A955I8D8_9BACT|nr:IS200/IS605 family transposase [Candidatus Dojkabacteria bacterium]MCB9789775.1 IS200/IS605 family transposase [Candidatus Nomurabacteria bacterium]MCB9790287.1 IS200/IS605 family transposase [Candidatus Nomurabacteria bacterium]
MKLTRIAHCVYHCEYHIVLVTKYRRKVFNNGVFAYVESKLAEFCKYYPQVSIEEVNHDEDHIHLLVSIPPTMRVGKVVGLLKSNTAVGLKQKFPFLKQVYWGTDSIWSEGYFVTTVGANESVIRKYIIRQGQEDSGQTLFE